MERLVLAEGSISAKYTSAPIQTKGSSPTDNNAAIMGTCNVFMLAGAKGDHPMVIRTMRIKRKSRGGEKKNIPPDNRTDCQAG